MYYLPVPASGCPREGVITARFTDKETEAREGRWLAWSHSKSLAHPGLCEVLARSIPHSKFLPSPTQLLLPQLVWAREVSPIRASKGLGQCHP